MFSSLRGRLVLILVVLSVAPLAVVTTIVSLQSFSALEQQSLDAQRETAQVIDAEITAFISERQNELFLLGAVNGLGRTDTQQQRTLLSSLMSYDRAYERVILLDADGQELFRLSRSEAAAALSDVNWTGSDFYLHPSTNGGIHYGNVYFDETLLEPLLTFSVPFYDLQRGELSSVLVADLRVKTIWDILSDTQLPFEGDVYVVDASGQVVAHKNPSVVLSDTTYQLPEMDGSAKGLSGEGVFLVTKSFFLGDSADENVQVFTIVVEQPVSSALSLGYNMLTIAAGVTLLAIVLAIAVGIFTVRQVTKPIVDMSAAAQKISQGDLSVRVKVEGQDEIGQLGTSFNSMVNTIQQREEDLNDLNISLQNRTNELVLANKEILETSRLKDEFLAIMSHELRTPLNAIIGFQGILAMTNRVTEDGKELVVRSRSNADRLLRLIDDILDISRMESGRMQIVPTPLRLTDEVEKWQTQMSVLAEQKNLAFTVNVDEELPIVINADEDAINKIVTNLLSNAFKFTEQGEVNLNLKRENGNWVIQVQDTGVGIPAHMHQIIFERFRQVDGSSRRKFGGSGLGLAIVDNLCKALDGTVSVQSEVGKGSTFTVSLPLSEPEVSFHDVS